MLRTKHFFISASLFLCAVLLVQGVHMFNKHSTRVASENASAIFAFPQDTYAVATQSDAQKDERSAFIQKVRDTYISSPETVSEDSVDGDLQKELKSAQAIVGSTTSEYGDTHI